MVVSCLCITTGTFSRNFSWWDLVTAHRDIYHLSMVCTWVAPAVFCTVLHLNDHVDNILLVQELQELRLGGLSDLQDRLRCKTESQLTLSVVGSEPPCKDSDQRFWLGMTETHAVSSWRVL